MSDLTSQIKKIALDNGSDLVGIAPVSRFEGAPEGHHPQDVLASTKSVISLARRFTMGMINSLDPGKQRLSYKHHMYHHLNGQNSLTAYQLAVYLENNGFESFVVQPTTPYDAQRFMGVISHRHAAVLAGLGVFGNNNLVLTPEFGPRNRFATVLTAAELQPDPLIKDEICQYCNQCREACPVSAWDPQSGIFYKPQCAHYQWWERSNQECNKPCGLCIKYCPVGIDKTQNYVGAPKEVF